MLIMDNRKNNGGNSTKAVREDDKKGFLTKLRYKHFTKI
jgi:hypothetical protein